MIIIETTTMMDPWEYIPIVILSLAFALGIFISIFNAEE